jgi:hypothetical protein
VGLTGFPEQEHGDLSGHSASASRTFEQLGWELSAIASPHETEKNRTRTSTIESKPVERLYDSPTMKDPDRLSFMRQARRAEFINEARLQARLEFLSETST